MAENTSPLDQLKSFLNQLFQFDSQDLDFGVYRILHYKRKEIKDFLDNLLVNKVKEQLHVLTAEETAKVKEQLANLERDEIIKGWIAGDENTRKVLEGISKDKINHYHELKGLSTQARASVETENHIYNHLSLFFSRYYDKGDFISKRRFGKNEKYVVPYNGEETHFHWANQDQYYVKSSETFQKYAFKFAIQYGTMVVNFKLTAAQVEQGNVKADETNYFVLSDKPAEIADDETSFFFEYRPLTDEEKKNIKGNSKQDSLNEQAYEQIRQETQAKVAGLNALWETGDSGIALLLKKLNHYTRKNKYDFFIHKNLKGFLERELDFYIKSELINVDDLYVSEAEVHFNRLKHNLKSIKVFKSIADTIIAFVSQIEDFQKKLWEKKKFVLSTEWVITIDRLVEYIGLEAATPILEEVINNEKQVAEWVELFGEENIPKTLSLDTLKADLHEWRKLPVDTKYFSVSFKINMLNGLSQNIDLASNLDGIMLNSDNYHGLSLSKNNYSGLIQSIYIDPPYNTSASEIIYKNSFKHSSWISLIENRLSISRDLLTDDGILCVTIDDFEYENLKLLLGEVFNKDLILGTIAIKNNPSGRSTTRGFSIAHEYGIFCGNSESTVLGRLSHSDKQVKRYDHEDAFGKYEWVNFRRHGGATALRKSQPKAFYPFYIDKSDNYRIPQMEWRDEEKKWEILENPKDDEIVVWPVAPNGEERVWKWDINSAKAKTKELSVRNDTTGNKNIYRKARINELGTLPLTIWDMSNYSATAYGTNVLISLFGTIEKFSFPKSIYAVCDSLRVSNLGENDLVLDYFAGSGTTFHSTQILNKEDGGRRKCILIEQGEYFHTVLIPRIKKIAYTFDWKDGKPKNGSMNGLGVFFKYQRLEQYEESLENIAFTAPEEATQMALKVDSYLPKYFLEFETRGSQALVNTTAMQDPWNYTLKVWDGFTYDTEQAVDLIETFNYLIGLHMQKCFTKQINDKKYQFIHGHNNANKKIVVVWRNVKDWTLDDYRADGEALNAELKDVARDLLYINEQANIDGYHPIEEVFKNKMLP
ncbi:MAG: site-specific DNA-methyltransferase [Lentimicrobium sp.]|jgi:adenine-specific DNA-methyltransferase|nr:site-specific DNA-methyltransferase [Lentimicrobium sp.]